MVSGCGTCRQPPHSCLGDRCQQQERKSALLGLWVLVPPLALDLPTRKGEPGPVHLTSWPIPWIRFTSFSSGLAVLHDLCLFFAGNLETAWPTWVPWSCSLQDVGKPSSTFWLTGELISCRACAQSSGLLPYFTKEVVFFPPHSASVTHTLVPTKENSILCLTTQMFVAQGGRPSRLRPLTQGCWGQSWTVQGLNPRNGTLWLLKF